MADYWDGLSGIGFDYKTGKAGWVECTRCVENDTQLILFSDKTGETRLVAKLELSELAGWRLVYKDD